MPPPRPAPPQPPIPAPQPIRLDRDPVRDRDQSQNRTRTRIRTRVPSARSALIPIRTLLALAAGLVLAVAISPPARAQQPADDWVGKRVITRYGTVLRVGAQVVDDENRSNDLAVSGRDRSVFRIYRVEQTNGPWLWLTAEKEGVQGWAQSTDVIPFDQAIDYFTAEIRANPASSVNYVNRATIWMEKGELDIAIADDNEAIRLDPNSEVAYYNRGLAWDSKKEYDRAIADYSEAIRLDPKYALAYGHRGLAWDSKKEYDRAIADYSEAIRLDPKDAYAYNGRGWALHSKKEYDRAIADYSEAIRLDPKLAYAYNNRAWLWATCPDARFRDGKRAVENATKACELSNWKDPAHIDTLAAACAEAGDFEQAVRRQSQAIELLTDAKKKEDYATRLKLYREKKPYRETSP